MTKKEIQNLMRREYLRGIIDGQVFKLPKNYSFENLLKQYKKYIKLNPSVKKDFINLTKQ